MAKREQFTPMLAVKYDPAKLYFPMIVSGKIDAIRCIILNGVALARSLLPIPNKHVQKLLGGNPALEGFDGELVVGSITASDVYTISESALMSEDGEPDFTFHVFDYIPAAGAQKDSPINRDTPYEIRLSEVTREIMFNPAVPSCVKLVPYFSVYGLEDLATAEKDLVGRQNYEGVMLRHPHGEYKYGRSTVNEGWLLKVKRFEDMEVRVIGFEEMKRNTNAAEIDERGYTKRSKSEDGMVAGGTLGKLLVVGLNGPFEGVEFSVGGGKGFTRELRDYIWTHQEEFLNKTGVVEFFPYGSKDAPRHPGWKGLRKPIDM